VPIGMGTQGKRGGVVCSATHMPKQPFVCVALIHARRPVFLTCTARRRKRVQQRNSREGSASLVFLHSQFGVLPETEFVEYNTVRAESALRARAETDCDRSTR